MTKEYKAMLRFLGEAGSIEIAEHGEVDGIDVIVCRLITSPLLLPDNLVGHCAKCFRMIQFRPHSPKLPKRMCDECIRPDIEAMRKSGGTVRFMVTENTARDLAMLAKKKRTS